MPTSNQKGFANILLIILAVLVVEATGYLILIQNPPNQLLNQHQNEPVDDKSSDTTPTSPQQTPVDRKSGQGGSGGGIRAGLDFRVEVVDHDIKKVATCDICNYSDFSDNDTYFQTREVHAKEGYVEMLFLKKSDYTPTHNGPEINYQDIFVTDEQQFNIGYHQVFRIKIGQTVSLQGADITIRVLAVTGLGCPSGSQC
ncbi:hypothetical protein COV04_04185 [Candidatus Uhrbacteria bacterium CG10_big_fil_rev_8_21_14_0_10_48_11]|uniref:Uncharacterized protein n=1 Tax=Candidatus Uhrbacteria bacterium CG10_big_fil_rev_8_21_14_0_10_48_11 TaxID=1975037 RepID=A0A2M8LDT6_9BACT|nr:MAG: hypothetical protein COV04_04185 [Candidatus Uhrbacteria bacterium CG10_big_fil_rev_8_21_14_0_10_48_11]